MHVAIEWNENDFEIIAAGDGEKVERWGKYILRRPDPQIIWPGPNNSKVSLKIDACYHRSQNGGGSWEFKNKLPEKWTIKYKNLSFFVQPTGFKHTGVFPEQAFNWNFVIEKIRSQKRPINVLNLFAYTGGATLACAFAGASVCHVDASKGMVGWAKENLVLSGLGERPVRFIVDDVIKFIKREHRRGNKYDAIIMDPPSYGRGPNGEIWKVEDSLFNFIKECMNVLSDNPLFFLINSYTTGFSSTVLKNMLNMTIEKKYKGNITGGEVGLPIRDSNLVLPCGIFGRWEAI